MKKIKHHEKRQQQSGSRAGVLVTFYVTRPRRDGTSASSSRNVHHHHRHHHLHGGSNVARRGANNGGCYDRRAGLLEYSRQLRAAAATTPPPPHRRNVKTVGAVRRDGRQPTAAEDHRLGRRRLERVMSQQQIRQSCFDGAWNWKRVLMLVLPCHSNVESKRTRKHEDDDDNKNKRKAWPAALLVGKLKVGRRKTNDEEKGLVKKLFCFFRQQSRLGR